MADQKKQNTPEREGQGTQRQGTERQGQGSQTTDPSRREGQQQGGTQKQGGTQREENEINKGTQNRPEGDIESIP